MSKGKDRKATVEILAGVLEDFGTAQVLNTPSDADRAEAMAALKDFPVDRVLRDAAIVSAQVLADVLHTMSLRPADYADVKELPEELLKLLKKNLSGDGADFFADVFRDHLKNRG